MKDVQNHISAYKSRYQRITLVILVIFPLVMFLGANSNSTLLIGISLTLVIVANLLAILNK